MDGTVSLCTGDGTVPPNTVSPKNNSSVLRVNISFILTYNHGGGVWLAKFKQPQYLLKQKSPGTTQTSEEDGEHIRCLKKSICDSFQIHIPNS